MVEVHKGRPREREMAWTIPTAEHVDPDLVVKKYGRLEYEALS
jgi:hypothetical protein